MAKVTERKIVIAEADGGTDGQLYMHHSGHGPGLLLVADAAMPPAPLRARASLFAEEGYIVRSVPTALDPDGIKSAAAQLIALPEVTGGPVCIAHGETALPALKSADAFHAIVAYDATDPASLANVLAEAPCPVVLQFGTRTASESTASADALRPALNPSNGSRLYVWPDAAPGFSLPGHAAFDRRIDSLAHTRTLEVIRRVVGPYYDYEALFAEHIRHEFETRDVDATMATMIDDPYVNHVATLAGGVGHDMLKRFYKYHFVDQNSRERVSTTVSMTPGPDRVVLELVVRFRHDAVLDRYFPGIAPTGKMVELATLLVVKFRGDKVCHEHIYWDQGSALKQIGVLETGDLPVAGPEAARKVLDEHLPSNVFMQDAWATSDGKPI